MKVLMFGWEFPPYNTGGLGTACYGLTKGLANNGIDITFVLPSIPDDAKADFVNLISAGNLSKIKLRGIKTKLAGYMTSEEYSKAILLKQIPHEQKETGTNRFEIMKKEHPTQYRYCMDKLKLNKPLNLVGIDLGEDNWKEEEEEW